MRPTPMRLRSPPISLYVVTQICPGPVSWSPHPTSVPTSAMRSLSSLVLWTLLPAPSFPTAAAMNRFEAFCAHFANYPLLQDGMSLNDRPPPYGTLPIRPVQSGDRRDPRSRDPRGPSSPEKRAHGRPRGLSESSLMDKDRRDRRDRGPRGEPRERTESEERRRRERRKEREERHRREKEKSGKSDRPAKKPQGLDIIDKLDVTGIYGQGRGYRVEVSDIG
nr:hypothetical protein CFP56_11446 [Quercus suber]